MSTLRVDTLYNRAKTTAPAIGVRPAVNDDSTKSVDSGWVQLELNDLLTQTRTVSGDWTFSGGVEFSGDPIFSGTPVFSGSPIFPVSMGVYTTVGVSNGSFSMAYEAGNTHTATKNDTGSATFVLADAMSAASQYVVLANVYGTSETNQLNCEVAVTDASTFIITVESDSGVNVDAEVRFMVFGVKA